MDERKTLRLQCRAVLLDLDGVLIDTTRIIAGAWTTWAEDRDLDPLEVMAAAHGRRSSEVIAAVAPHLVAETEAKDLEERESQATHKIEAIAGARELLASLPGDSWAVVTSCGRELALHRISLAGLPLPQTLVSADEVVEGKPHPEGYLMGARKLGVEAGECVVLEDAPAGIEAARAAGMMIVGVTTTYEKEDLRDTDAVVRWLRDVRVASIDPDGEEGFRIELEVNAV